MSSIKDMSRDVVKFVEFLESWNGNEIEFQDVLILAVVHTAAAQSESKQNVAFVRDFSISLAVPQFMVRDWISGVETPPRVLARALGRMVGKYLREIHFLDGDKGDES